VSDPLAESPGAWLKPGTLPSGWANSTLDDVIAQDGVFRDGDWVETKDQDPQGNVRLTQLADIGEGAFRNRSTRFLREDQAAALKCTFLEPGDVLVARMPDPLGRACVFSGLSQPAVTAVDVCIVRPGSNSVDPRWLMWTINAPTFRARIAEFQTGTTRRRISRKNLARIEFPVPPLNEQWRIVAAIEEHLSRLDAADVSLAAALRRLDVSRGQFIEDAMRGDWPSTTLGEIAEIAGGVTKDAKRQGDPAFVEVPYLRVANVQRGYLDLREVTTIRVSPQKAAALKLEPGDVLFNEGGDRDKLGRGWVWSGEIENCIHQNHVFRARLNGDFDPRFVSWHGNTFGRTWFEQHGRQTTNLASLNLTTLKSFPVPLPPLEEQRRIVAEVEERLSKIDAMRTSISNAQRRSAALRAAILERAFRGELVPQDPADEPAEALLARIRTSFDS
jgi:type I restriction enzyme S subunit